MSARGLAVAGTLTMLVCGLALSGCTVDDTGEQAAPAPTGSIATRSPDAGASSSEEGEVTVTNYPQAWAENWCAARKSATGDEAIALMGEPTNEWGSNLYWEASDPDTDGPGFQLALGLGSDGAVTSTSAVNVPPELECSNW